MAESTKNQQKAATLFAQEWQGKGYEKGDTQRFWLELLQKVLGVEDPYSFISFEDEVMVDKINRYIDMSKKFESTDNGILELEDKMISWSYRNLSSDLAERI